MKMDDGVDVSTKFVGEFFINVIFGLSIMNQYHSQKVFTHKYGGSFQLSLK